MITRTTRADKTSYWGVGMYHPKFDVNLGMIMRSAACFGASFTYQIGSTRYSTKSTDTTNTQQMIPHFYFDDFEGFRAAMPKIAKIICVEFTNSAHMLSTSTVHPKQAVYLLGAEDVGLPTNVLDTHTVWKINSQYCLNVSQAATIVMHDRVIKE